jgi:hypothetical protein
MKATSLSAFLFFVFLTVASAGPGIWTHQTSEGEDASSVHHYLYAEEKGEVKRVRWIWNGGAQNDPTVTEFVIGADQITVKEFTGARKHADEIITGKDTSLKLDKETTIPTGGKSVSALLETSPKLTEDQRGALENLESILSMEREPVK